MARAGKASRAGGGGPPSGWESVYRVVRRIPAGKVASYGQIAALAGMPGAARQVGWALNALESEDDVPWHRVINARGEVSARGVREIEDLHRALLDSEGVEFSPSGRVDIARFGWQPRATRTRAKAGSKQTTTAGNGKRRSTKRAATKGTRGTRP